MGFWLEADAYGLRYIHEAAYGAAKHCWIESHGS